MNTQTGKPRVALVYPPVVMRDRYFRIARWVVVPPQGIAFLGAVLRREGYPVTLIDANAEKLGVDEVLGRLKAFQPDVVGLSATTLIMSNAAAIAEEVKKWNPGITTILGGPHASVAPEETLARYASFDYAAIGEAERTLPEFLERLGGSMDDIPGLAWRADGGERVGPRRELIENLDTLPQPAYDLLPDLRRYYQHVVIRVDRMPSASVLVSRGCAKGRCVFCARDIYGFRSRIHGADYILELFRRLMRDYGVRSINFEDEDLLAHRETMSEVCKRMIDEKMNLSWAISGRVDFADEDFLRLMKRAGCWHISYGIESGSPEILKNIKKGITPEAVRRSVAVTKKAGIKTKGFFMIGLPGETIETIRETADFSRAIGLDYFQVSYTVPFPGTELHRRAKEWGTYEADWDGLNIWNPVFIPNGLTRELLVSESLRAFRRFYFRPAVLADFLKRVVTTRYILTYLRDGFRFLGFLARG